MRNWKPYIAQAVKQAAADGMERLTAVCLAPQNSRTSVGLYRSAVVGDGNLPFKMEFVEEWHDQPLLAKAFAEKLRAGWEKACAESGAKLPVIFTAHSVPQRTITEGDPYERQAKETAQLVAKEAGLGAGDWTFAFQSQGMSGGAWIGPTVEDTIRDLKAKGHRGVFLDPIGFVCDHVEVLYDIDIAFKQFAEKEGMGLWRAESLNGSKILTEAIAEVVRGRK
jgi:ferrochelatase